MDFLPLNIFSPDQLSTCEEITKSTHKMFFASFTRLGEKEELRTPVGEAVDVTCTEHNHPPDWASKKLVSSMRN